MLKTKKSECFSYFTSFDISTFKFTINECGINVWK